MARIPTYTVPQVTPQPAPQVRIDPGETRGAFGEAAGAAQAATGEAIIKAAGQVGNTIVEQARANRRLDDKYDALTRQEALNETRARLDEAFQAERQGGNAFATPADIQRYREKVDEITRDVIRRRSSFLFNEESALVMQQELSALSSQYHSRAVEAGLKEADSRLERWADEESSKAAGRVFENPAALDDAIAGITEHVNRNYAPGKTPGETALRLNKDIENVATAAVDHYTSVGDLDRALAVLDEQVRAGRISSDRRRQLSNRILDKRVELKLKVLEEARNQPRILSSDEVKRIYGATLPPEAVIAVTKNGFQRLDTQGDRKADAAVWTGEEARKRLGSAYREGDIVLRKTDGNHEIIRGESALDLLGKGERGRAIMLLDTPGPAGTLSLLERFAQQLTTPREDRLVLDLMTSAMEVNANTGEKIMSPSHARALRQRGIDPSTFGDPEANIEGLFPPERGAAAGESGAAAPGQPAASSEGTQDADPIVRQVFPQELETALAGRTIAEWVMSPESGGYTGPEAAVRSFVGRTPFVGQGQGMIDTTRKAIPLAMKRLVKALQQNPRFAEGERIQLEADLAVDPRLWDNPTAMLGELAGVHVALRSMENELINAIRDPKMSRAQRRADQTSLRLIQAAIDRLTPEVIMEPDPEKRRQLVIEFSKNNPPGTPVIFLGLTGSERNRWVLKRTKGQPKAAGE